MHSAGRARLPLREVPRCERRLPTAASCRAAPAALRGPAGHRDAGSGAPRGAGPPQHPRPGRALPCPARVSPTSGQQVDEHEQRQVEEDEEPQVQPVRLPRQRRRRHRRRVPLRRRLLPAPRPRCRRRHLLTQLRHGTARGRRSLRRRLRPFRTRSQWEASARSRAATPQGGAAASRDGRWRPLAAVGRGLPLWQTPSALCRSVRAASGSLRRDLCGNKRSPLAVSAPWRAGGSLEQTERLPRKIPRENVLVLASWWQLGHLQAAWRNSCTPWVLKHATA